MLFSVYDEPAIVLAPGNTLATKKELAPVFEEFIIYEGMEKEE
jgi:hypothetical protein